MFTFIAALAAFITIAFAGPLSRQLDGKIIGGDEIPIEAAPYQVSIQYNGDHICGGTIISKNWVITAAHCVYPDPTVFMIHAGSSNSKKPGSVHRVNKIIAGDDYDSADNEANDIALLRIEDHFEFDETRQPIDLYNENEEVPVGSVATITGWGLIDETTYPDILHLVRIPIISKERCAQLYIEWDLFSKGEICAMTEEGGKDSCSGDSGGPLVVDGRLAGVVSWGEGCALPQKPGVYAEIAYFRNWIKTHSGI